MNKAIENPPAANRRIRITFTGCTFAENINISTKEYSNVCQLVAYLNTSGIRRTNKYQKEKPDHGSRQKAKRPSDIFTHLTYRVKGKRILLYENEISDSLDICRSE